MFTRSMMIRFFVDDTKLEWDLDYFRGVKGHNPRTDPRMGVFQNHDGKFNLDVMSDDIISIPKKNMDTVQRRYQMESGHDEDFVIVPTLESITRGDVPLPFRVNHSNTDPTHELRWISSTHDYPDSHYVLKGIKEIESGTEITFDYNL